jgi:hypothetical protein
MLQSSIFIVTNPLRKNYIIVKFCTTIKMFISRPTYQS